jgi:hypothetical protein
MAKSKDESRRRYQDQEDARRRIVSSLSDAFEFWHEVWAIGPDGDQLRIDAVSKCKETGWTFGWEFKRSHLYMKEFAPALRQAIHYRLARLIDSRLIELNGRQLPAIAVFPDWFGEHDQDDVCYDREAEGMRLLAAQLRVGTMRECDNDHFSFKMGQSAIWHSWKGWTGNAEGVLFGSRGIGSMRRKDR